MVENRIKNILKEYVQGLVNLIGDDLKNVMGTHFLEYGFNY